MNKSVKFLLNFFGIATLLCWINVANGGLGDGGGLGGDDGPSQEDPGTVAPDTNLENLEDFIGRSYAVTKRLCPSGQYVYKCGNYRIGFDWLKGLSTTKTTTEEVEADNNNACLAYNTTVQNNTSNPDSETETYTSEKVIIKYTWENQKCIKTTITTRRTRNYYTTNDQSDLLQQMRDFFAAKENTSINSCTEWNKDTYSCVTNNTITADGDEGYATDRDKILKTVCNPFDSEAIITCAYCPDSANIDASTVVVNSVLKTTSSWKFHTIADCYIHDFTDSTGTYKYVKPEENTSSSTGENCYYSNTNTEAFSMLQGDSIENFDTSSSSTSSTTLTITLPSSGTRKKSGMGALSVANP